MNGTELKALRKQLGLSLRQSAAQVEVTISTWCRWESGETPVPERAVKLYRLLNNVPA